MANSSIYGIIFILLIETISTSSFFCCYSQNAVNTNENPLGSTSQVYIRARLRSRAPTYRQSSDEPGLRSILKHPNRQSKAHKTHKRVSFSPEIGSISEIESEEKDSRNPNTFEVLNHHAYSYSPEVDSEYGQFIPIFFNAPFNYEVEDGNKIEEHLAKYRLPEEFIKVIKGHYPGLKDVLLKIDDIVGLIVFASFFNNSDEFFRTSNLVKFFQYFIAAFPESSKLIASIKISKGSYRITRISAFNGLMRVAFDNSLFYTIEAYYVLFGDSFVRNFLKNSIVVKNKKIFARFFSLVPNFSKEKILSWAIQYGNVEIYNDFIYSDPYLESTTKYFVEPVIIYIAQKMYYFPGIVEKLIHEEIDSFEYALNTSVMSGNHELFRDLIKYNNEMFPSYDPKVLNELRLIFSGTSSQKKPFSEYIAKESHLQEIFVMLLKLGCDDPAILEYFREALPDLLASPFIKDILVFSLFSKTSEYFKMLTKASDQLTLVFSFKTSTSEEEFGIVSICDIIRNGKNYAAIIEEIAISPSFSVLNAISDPTFPLPLWTALIDKFPQINGLEHASYEKLSGSFSYNFELLKLISSHTHLNIWDLDQWRYLDLAVLNFNPNAVKAILAKSDNRSEIIIAFNFAKALQSFFETCDDVFMLLEPYFLAKVTIIQHFRESFPDFYTNKVDSSFRILSKFIYKLESDINIIVLELENYMLNTDK